MSAADPIRDVSVVSTGSVVIRPEHVGPTRKNLYLWLFTSRRWTEPLPINVYVIEHEQGIVLFDTGQDRASVTDRDYFPGGFNGLVYSRLAKFDIGPDETLTARLRHLGHDPRDVHTAVLSHLHQDHIGGLRDLRSSRILLSRAEWDEMAGPFPEARGFLPRHIDLPGLRWDLVEPEQLSDPSIAPFTHGHDIFADGSLVLIPTPGHTAGSLSLLVRRPGRRPLLMVGDLTYDDDLLADGALPGAGDKRVMRETTRMVNRLRSRLPGLVVLPAHDPGAAGRLEAAWRLPTDSGAGASGRPA